MLSATVHDITKITGENWALVDDQGLQVVTECFAGMTVEEFNKANENAEDESTAFTQTMYAIADELGLHVISEKLERMPRIAKTDLYVEKVDFSVRKGSLAGFSDTVTMETEEGITLVSTFVEKISEGGRPPSMLGTSTVSPTWRRRPQICMARLPPASVSLIASQT